MADKELSKKDEIILIEKLRIGNGYFADYFSEDDMDKMISNIQNDFPILNNTLLDNRIGTLVEKANKSAVEIQSLQAGIKTRNTTIDDLEKDNLEMKNWKRRVLISLILDENIELLDEHFTEMEIIKQKLTMNSPLNENESKYILSNLP